MNIINRTVVLTLVMVFSLNIFAAKQDNKGGKGKKKKKVETAKTEKTARAVMWKDPGRIEDKNLFYGEGGADASPDLNSKFTFVENVTSGTQKKILVTDNQKRQWVVKYGPEAKSEVTAARLLWAVGYHTDQDFFVQKVRIEEAAEVEAADVRFERDDDGFKKVANWDWNNNPFLNTRDLDGLKVMSALIRNWDLKLINNKVVRPSKNNKTANQDENIYYVSDLGATLGRSGTVYNIFPFLMNVPPDRGPLINKSEAKGNPKAFEREHFIDKIKDDRVTFFSKRKDVRKILSNIPIENVKWITGMLGRLSDNQLYDAFRAGGFNDEEINLFVQTIRARIQELQKL